MAVTDVDKIITTRIGYEDSHTIERYLATGGYEGLKKALAMTPEAVAAEVDAASLLGRGGAGFPAGRKWSMLRKDPVTYLVINGDESEPATFKDHLLVERDPHQLIEGVLIAAYALQVSQAFIISDCDAHLSRMGLRGSLITISQVAISSASQYHQLHSFAYDRRNIFDKQIESLLTGKAANDAKQKCFRRRLKTEPRLQGRFIHCPVLQHI